MPPYQKKDIPYLLATGFVLLAIPVAVFFANQQRNISSSAAGLSAIEAESGTVAGNVSEVNDANASGGKYVRFGTQGASGPGAVLPISYELTSLTGNVRYVATTGNDTSGTGTVGSPYATLSKAVSSSIAGDTIVIRGGVYRQGNVSVSSSKTLKIIAYPGETPTFNGAQTVSGGWVAEGSLSYIPYTPRPATNGSGISFTTGENLTGDGIGKYPDQAWIGSTQLREVSAKTDLVAGTFWVDRTNNRLYMTGSDSGQNGIEVSQKNKFINVQSPNTSIEGIKITRFSNSASDYGVVIFGGTADNSLMRNVEISESAFSALLYDGSSNINNGSMLKNVTITTSNWMGVDVNTADNLTVDSSKITNMNLFNEFTFSPQSGAIKTSRSDYIKVTNSEFSGNNSHVLWFDQSNYDVQVANNNLYNNNGSAVFFEISDNLLMINNYVRSTSGQPVKLAGSSGLKVINNTIIGGKDPIGVYTDSRSKPGCADPSQPLCTGSYNSDRDTARPYRNTLDWIPRLDLMINNIIAYPTASQFCGVTAAICFTQSNSGAVVPIETTIHKADAARNIPQTEINGNVYANGSGTLIAINTPLGKYTSTGTFSSAMAGSPVSISGFETSGLHGNSYVGADGTPTGALSAIHSQAVAIPTNSVINQYIPAGTRHYGVTYK